MLALKASAVAHEREIDRLVGAGKRAEFVQTLRRLAEGLSRST
jgi:hypothetical protein